KTKCACFGGPGCFLLRCLLQRRKERGRIAVESVHVVEQATLGSGGLEVAGSDSSGGNGGGGGGVPPGLPFQVGYREAGQEYTLYLVAAREQDRADWIRAIRAVCSENPGLSGRYHTGFWSGKRWSCCRMSSRSAEGCDTCSSWSTSSKPSSVASITSASNTTAVTTTTTTTTTCSEANNNPIVQARSNNGEFTKITPRGSL
ncbi:tyrosine-protein kinase Btk29A-like, partial [Phymastichus coffea]|uniref:tyrosine-protein kinase Btk29A-like n=1 Tax=Phymastichus coffea TaxID=108790 RepID=UPI00273CE607